MKFSIFVSATPYQGQGCQTAFAFTSALLKKHCIEMVYLTGGGVLMASKNMCVPSDEPNWFRLWTELAKTHDFTLSVCSASATRYGLIGFDKEHSCQALDLPFSLAGFASFIEAQQNSDKVVFFNHD